MIIKIINLFKYLIGKITYNEMIFLNFVCNSNMTANACCLNSEQTKIQKTLNQLYPIISLSTKMEILDVNIVYWTNKRNVLAKYNKKENTLYISYPKLWARLYKPNIDTYDECKIKIIVLFNKYYGLNCNNLNLM